MQHEKQVYVLEAADYTESLYSLTHCMAWLISSELCSKLWKKIIKWVIVWTVQQVNESIIHPSTRLGIHVWADQGTEMVSQNPLRWEVTGLRQLGSWGHRPQEPDSLTILLQWSDYPIDCIYLWMRCQGFCLNISLLWHIQYWDSAQVFLKTTLKDSLVD